MTGEIGEPSPGHLEPTVSQGPNGPRNCAATECLNRLELPSPRRGFYCCPLERKKVLVFHWKCPELNFCVPEGDNSWLNDSPNQSGQCRIPSTICQAKKRSPFQMSETISHRKPNGTWGSPHCWATASWAERGRRGSRGGAHL